MRNDSEPASALLQVPSAGGRHASFIQSTAHEESVVVVVVVYSSSSNILVVVYSSSSI